VAHSSESPNQLYTVKAGIQRSLVGRIGHETMHFTLLAMGEFRGTLISHCSCAAGQKLQFCKHLARLLQFCVPDFPHFGAVREDVPTTVHGLAVHCEKGGFIQQTSSHERNNVPRSIVDVTEFKHSFKLIPLLNFGYISPHYAWGVKGYVWESSDEGKFKIVETAREAIED
jgi:hypothetical protein